jgi:hypothetical protein
MECTIVFSEVGAECMKVEGIIVGNGNWRWGLFI